MEGRSHVERTVKLAKRVKEKNHYSSILRDKFGKFFYIPKLEVVVWHTKESLSLRMPVTIDVEGNARRVGWN